MALNDRKPTWIPFAILFLGAWLITSSWTFGYAHTPVAMNENVCGLLLLIFGWRSRRNIKSYYMVAAIGVWLQLAPLLWRAPTAAGYITSTFLGLLLIVFSALISDEKAQEGVNPPGWSYNPSSYVQRFPVAVLALICWFLARCLASYQLGYIDTIWEPFFGQGTVEVITSKISRLLPVPDAGLGAFAYTLEFLLCFHGGENRWRDNPWVVLSFGLLVVPVGLISILLIILQPLVVHAWCTLCLLTAAAMLFMITLTIDEVAATLRYLKTGKTEDIKIDKSVSLSDPMPLLIKAFFLGCRPSWNLIAASICGIFTMFLPSYWKLPDVMSAIDHVVGALAIVISVISFANVAQKARFALWLCSAILILASLITTSGSSLVIHLAISLSLALLALKKVRNSPIKLN